MKKIKGVFKTALFFALFFCGCLLSKVVFAYDNDIAHPGIAQMAVELYNENYDPDLTKEEEQWVMRGATEEDTPTRWFNHFYDPVYNVGFSDLGWLGNFTGFSFAKAPEWAQNSMLQPFFSLGDRSWPRALRDYADNDREMAFIELGHLVHLISDMAVPAHTRNSEHVGDNYESFVKNNWENIKTDLSVRFFSINNLNQVFESLASWTNENFYSEKTIESKKYKAHDFFIKTIVKHNEKFTLAISADDNFLYIIEGSDWLSEDKTLKDPYVLSDYTHRLVPQAVGYSAGAIKYFIDEGEKLKKEREEMSWWNKFWQDDVFGSRINPIGVLNEKIGWVIGLGEVVVDKFEIYSNTAPSFITQAELDNLTKESTVSIASVSVENNKQNISEVAFNIDEEINIEQIFPENDIPDKEVLGEKIESSDNVEEDVESNPESPVTVIKKPLSASAGFNPVTTEESLGETDDENIATTTPEQETENKEIIPAPILDEVFSQVIYTSSSEINIFGTTSSSADLVNVYYSRDFTTDTFYNYFDMQVAVSAGVWQVNAPLSYGANSFKFSSESLSGVTSTFSESASVWLDDQAPIIYFVSTSTESTTGSVRIFLNFSSEEDDSGVFYNLSYIRNNGESMNLLDLSPNTDFELSVGQSGEYTFELSACDGLGNCSVPIFETIDISEIITNYVYLDGEQADTEVVLTKENSPYILKNYTVPSGKKLIVEPGVMIKAVHEGSLNISGELSAVGSPDDQIVFTSLKDQNYDNDILNTVTLAEKDDLVFDDWYGIEFFENASGTIAFAEIKYSGFLNYFKYFRYDTDCAFSHGVLATDAVVNISSVNFVKPGQTDICGIHSDISVEDVQFNGFTDQTERVPVVLGRDGIWASRGTLTIRNSSFKNYSHFPVYLGKDATGDFSDLQFEDNMFDSVITQVYDNNHRYIFAGDDFYIFQSIDLGNYLFGQLNFNKYKKIYLMSNNEFSGDLTFSGTPEEKLEIILLSEYGGSVKFSGDMMVFDNTIIKMNEPNLLWFSLLGRGMRGAPGLYGWVEDQTYGEYLSNNISLNNNTSNSVVNISGSRIWFNNSEFLFGPVPYQFLIVVDGSELTLNNTSLGWDFIDNESLSLREDLKPVGIYFIGGSISLDKVDLSHFYYGIYFDPNWGFYNSPPELEDVLGDEGFLPVKVFNEVNFDDVVIADFPVGSLEAKTSVPVEAGLLDSLSEESNYDIATSTVI